MAHCAIHEKGSDSITYFIRDCVQDGRNFRGSSGSVTGVKEYLFDTKWTETLVEFKKSPTGEIQGFSHKVSECSEARRYKGTVVSTLEDVDRVTRGLIEAKYPSHEEAKIHRQKLAGGGEKEFKEYNDFVDNLVKEGRAFKASMEV